MSIIYKNFVSEIIFSKLGVLYSFSGKRQKYSILIGTGKQINVKKYWHLKFVI